MLRSVLGRLSIRLICYLKLLISGLVIILKLCAWFRGVLLLEPESFVWCLTARSLCALRFRKSRERHMDLTVRRSFFAADRDKYSPLYKYRNIYLDIRLLVANNFVKVRILILRYFNYELWNWYHSSTRYVFTFKKSCHFLVLFCEIFRIIINFSMGNSCCGLPDGL